MKPSYDSSQEEVDEPVETESKCSSAIMDQNTSSIKSNKVTIIRIFWNMKSRDIALWKRATCIYSFMYFRSRKLNN